MPDCARSPDFYSAFRGHFSGVLAWKELDALWAAVRSRATAGWYLYVPGEAVPAAPASAEEIVAFIEHIDALLRREHREDYCGIVYADDRAAPALIKIFDPHRLGVVCGFSANPPLPGWILSRIPPAALPGPDEARKPRRRRRIFQR